MNEAGPRGPRGLSLCRRDINAQLQDSQPTLKKRSVVRLLQVGETLHPELQIITSVFNKVKYRGE
ncbi:hypothetical protein K0M31_005554 [Melipona bicolor]|uniref:Uncharacterized protein n=1 Tax=Melipona bicolor TaxID=60889 RepID=A0AA40FVI7_9HYME|nr:hypothetical protein K0M31_005554 [Melipona bicolor]